MTKILKTSLLLGVTIIPFILRHLLKRHYQKLALILKERDDKSYYQCIFFDYKNFNCRPHLINRQECGEHCSYVQLERLLHYIGSAKNSISLCMYILTLKQVANELVNASRRGVIVRIITDKAMGETKPAQSNLRYLQENGISHKTPSSRDEMMHHKYCLIDEKDPHTAKVFFGSINLTAQAFCKNFEALIFTNNRDIIQKLGKEFEELWELFEAK